MAVAVVVVVTTLFIWSIIVTALPTPLFTFGSSLLLVTLLLLLLVVVVVIAVSVRGWEELADSLSLKLPLLLFFGLRNITLGSIIELSCAH